MTRQKTPSCKRTYSLGKRLELSNGKRARILASARARLQSDGEHNLTLDSLARESGVTRQTIHNLFGTKIRLLEELFDQLASDGGMQRMRSVIQEADPETMLARFVEVFTGFWATHRLLIRRIHGIAAIDPELGAAVEARNQRRQRAAARVIDSLDRSSAKRTNAEKLQRIATLYALTSFEFFDAMAEGCASTDDAARLVLRLVQGTLETRN